MKRPGSLILFLLLVLGGGFALGFLTAPGEWYGGLAKPTFNPPAWALRSGLDNALCPNCRGGLAYLRTRSQRFSDEAMVDADGPEFSMDAGVLQYTSNRPRLRHHPAAACHHPRLHRRGVAARSIGCVAVHALRRLGGLRHGAERFDLFRCISRPERTLSRSCTRRRHD